jgi:hypothetical protein
MAFVIVKPFVLSRQAMYFEVVEGGSIRIIFAKRPPWVKRRAGLSLLGCFAGFGRHGL